MAAAAVACPIASVSAPYDQLLKRPVTVVWRDVPARTILARLSATAGAPVLLDRRIDPSAAHSLESRQQPLSEVIEQSAEAIGGVPHYFSGLIYVAPASASDLLTRLTARDRQARAASSGALDEPITMSWQELASPSDLILQSLKGSAWRVTNPDAVPFDLWPRMDEATLTRREWLTLLLLGFGLTYEEVGAGELTIVAAPQAPVESAAKPRSRPTANTPARSPIAAQRITFRVKGEPAERVLRSLAEGLALELRVAPAAEGRLQTLISIDARDQTVDGVLRLLGEACGLRVERAGQRIVVDAVP